ncbi:Pal1 cell morphology protein-domain-containing protein [Phyllosticta capitalensis]
MSVVPGEHRTPSPALTLNLSSNNPFRNHASPQPSPALSTPRTTAPRPQSRNPFLSLAEQDHVLQRPKSSYAHSHFSPPLEPQRSSAFIRMPTAQEEKQAAYLERAEQLFNELKLKEDAEKAAAAAGRPGIHRSGTTPSSRAPRGPADKDGRKPSSSRPPPGGRRPPPPREELDIFASPERSAPPRRPRRNSESSVMERRDVDDERRRRERRARERRERDGERTERSDRKERSKDPRVRKPKGLDIIDKLDVSGIYGPSMFHHDGPFDACNPHRNRGRDRNAPMQAFPEGSANNVMGGAGPVNSKMNLDQFHGRGAEGFSDFSAARTAATATEPEAVANPAKPAPGAGGWYNPKANIEFIHGDESNGLGTSTFLEGAPASKKDLERRQSENEQMMANGGLKRSKSLAQRIRGISQPRRDYMAARNMPSPNGEEFRRPPPPPPVGNGQVTPDGRTHSANGSRNERNPFFDDYDDAYEKKGNTIKIAEQPKPTGRARAPSSPGQRAYDLPATNGSNSPDGEQKTGGGFLTRMKSLKGGPRRPRPADRRPS